MSDYKPITGELRDAMCPGGWVERDGSIMFTTSPIPSSIDVEQSLAISGSDFDRLCDAIDAIHAGLEAENERLKQDVAMCAESEQEKCIAYLRKENIDWEDKYLHVAVENARLREQIDTLVIYVESDGTKYSVDDDGNQHFDHSNTRTSDGLMELLKDADGEYIRVGDVMEWVDIEGEVTLTCEVAAVGVECFFAWDKANGRYAQKSASAYRHHHAPTVEDVLREFGRGWHEQMNGPETFDIADYVERYAAKLRLAESEDA